MMPAPSVLVVEDDLIIGWHLRHMLEGIGCHVCATAVAEDEAVAAAEKHRPDLVLMDLRLAGGGSGAAAAERIRTDLSAPIVFCTAHGDDPQFRHRIEKLGLTAVLSKPVRQDQLEEVIKRFSIA